MSGNLGKLPCIYGTGASWVISTLDTSLNSAGTRPKVP